MEKVRHYQDLLVWSKSVDFVTAIYRLTKNWPETEKFGLTRQIRGAACSVPCNIAEGKGRRTEGDFHRFLLIANGSLMEVETQLFIAANLEYISQSQLTQLLGESAEIGKLLSGLIATITKSRLPAAGR